MATQNDNVKPSLNDWFTRITVERERRPSFITFEIKIDPGRLALCLVTFYMATALEDKAQFGSLIRDKSEAESFMDELKQQGYLQQPSAIWGNARRVSLAAPESIVGDIHPLGVLLPRVDSSHD